MSEEALARLSCLLHAAIVPQTDSWQRGIQQGSLSCWLISWLT